MLAGIITGAKSPILGLSGVWLGNSVAVCVGDSVGDRVGIRVGLGVACVDGAVVSDSVWLVCGV